MYAGFVQDYQDEEFDDEELAQKPKKKARAASKKAARADGEEKKHKAEKKESKAAATSTPGPVAGGTSLTPQQLIAQPKLLWNCTRESLEHVVCVYVRGRCFGVKARRHNILMCWRRSFTQPRAAESPPKT